MENKKLEQIKYEELELLIEQLEKEVKFIKNNIVIKEKILADLKEKITNQDN